MKKFRFHILGLVHLPVSSIFNSCAYTMKIHKLSRMLLDLGHETILYGAESSNAPCTRFVQTHTLKDIRKAWGDGDNRPETNGLGYRWRESGFRHDWNKNKAPATLKYEQACIEAITKDSKPDDFLLLSMGAAQKPVADAANLYLTCEPGVGYRGSYTRFKAFESFYMMNYTYGFKNGNKSINGNYYDRVIPNYFDEKDFPFQNQKEDYYFYIGRMITRKGIDTAVKAVNAVGAKLVLAGQGEYKTNGGNLNFIGHVDAKRRAKLMGGARAVFVPTQYLEPFGGVAVEAQLCGTPVITTNFGAFPETVIDGVTGYLCNTLDDFVQATKFVDGLDPSKIRAHAEKYLMKNVKWEFQRWFSDLYQLYLSAVDDSVKGWHHIREEYPEWRHQNDV